MAAAVLAACAGPRSSSALDKKTDWLGSCEETRECREGLECVRGMCTTRCRERTACAKHGDDAICAAVSAANECEARVSLAPPEYACTLACERRAQCAARNDALVCVANACAGDPCSPADDAAVGDDGSVASPEDGGSVVALADAALDDASEPDADEPDGAGMEIDEPDGSDPDPDEPDSSVACVDLDDPLSGDGRVPMPVTTEAQVTRVPMSALELAAHRGRGRLYALATADDAEHPGQLVVIDADTAQIIDAVSVGAEPSTLAIADDESKLWIGSLSRFELREVSLSGAVPTLTATYALPAAWMSSDSLVVAAPAESGLRPTLIDYRQTPNPGAFIGQVTFASGQAIASPASGYSLPAVAAGPPGWFFAYDSYSSGSELHSIDARSANLSTRTSHGILIEGDNKQITYDVDGFLYARSGVVIDVRDPSAPRRAGRFAYSGKYLPIANDDRVLMVDDYFRSPAVVQLLETSTFKRLSWLELDVAYDSIGSAVALNEDRAAFIATGAQGPGVYLTNAVATAIPLGQVEATSSEPGSIEVAVGARALAMDHARGLLYAAVGSGVPAYENRVVVIEPSTGKIVKSFHAGSNPMALALSDDGATLWVSLEGSWEVRRIDLSCANELNAEDAYLMPFRAAARRLFAMPGRPESFVAQVESYTAIYDDGVLRPSFSLGELSGASRMVAGPPGVLFGYQDSISSFGFLTVLYDDDDVTAVVHDSLLSGYSKPLAYDPDGFVYAATGEVIDVRDPLQPTYVGSFDMAGGGLSGILPLPGPVAISIYGAGFQRLDAATFSIGEGRTTGCTPASAVADPVYVAAGRIAFIVMRSAGDSTSGSICIVTDPELIP